MKTPLKLLFGAILAAMLAVTTWASLHESIVPAAVRIWNDPWGRATLFDTYFAFLAFYLWVFYKQTATWSRIAWFILVMVLGNIAMAIYMLRELARLKDDESWATLLTRRNG
jgi:hypothetical protein